MPNILITSSLDRTSDLGFHIAKIHQEILNHRSENIIALRYSLTKQYGHTCFNLMQQILSDPRRQRVTINAPVENLVSILESGKILNAYEAMKTSADVNDFDPSSAYYRRRLAIENQVFGLDENISLILRPRYAALDYSINASGAAPIYGKSFLILKPTVLFDATFSVRDLFQCNDPNDLFLFDLLALKTIQWNGDRLLRSILRPYRTMDMFDSSYIEVHIHRPLYISDMHSLIIHESDAIQLTQEKLQWLEEKCSMHKVRLSL